MPSTFQTFLISVPGCWQGETGCNLESGLSRCAGKTGGGNENSELIRFERRTEIAGLDPVKKGLKGGWREAEWFLKQKLLPAGDI